MAFSKKIKLALLKGGKSATLSELAPLYGVSPRYAGKKINSGKLSASELIKTADYCGCELAFVFPNGDKVSLNTTDLV